MQVNRIFVDVDYSQKEKAKELGCKWDINEKKWYIPNQFEGSPDKLKEDFIIAFTGFSSEENELKKQLKLFSRDSWRNNDYMHDISEEQKLKQVEEKEQIEQKLTQIRHQPVINQFDIIGHEDYEYEHDKFREMIETISKCYEELDLIEYNKPSYCDNIKNVMMKAYKIYKKLKKNESDESEKKQLKKLIKTIDRLVIIFA